MSDDVIAARATYDAMTPPQQATVRKFVDQGRDRVAAVKTVAQMAKDQSGIEGADDTPDVPSAEPTASEKNGAFGLAMANKVSGGIMPSIRRLVGDIGGDRIKNARGVAGAGRDVAALTLLPLTGVVGPLAATVEALRGGDTDSAEAQASRAAPLSYGAGELAGDAANLPQAAAGGVGIKRVAEAAAPRVGSLAKGAVSRLLGFALDAAEESPVVGKILKGAGSESFGTRGVTGKMIKDAVPAPKATPATPVQARAAAEPIDAEYETTRQSPQPAQTPIRGLLGDGRNAVDDADVLASDEVRARALEDMPSDVMAAETARPPPPPPAAAPTQRLPTITGSGEQLVAHVKSLPPAQRVAFIKRIAGDMGKDTAAAVAKAAGVSLKLDPL